jgi:hypothetical protein
MPARPFRILWLFRHRTARHEEAGALVRTGAEVIPIAGVLDAFPNAVELPERDDPWYPTWRNACTVPEADLRKIREHDYYRDPDRLPDELVEALNRSVQMIVVGTFPRIALALLRRFRGTVVLRPYGGYPYTRSLGILPTRNAALDLFARSERYVWCPILPYQSLVEDPRLTRNELYWPAAVSSERLGAAWARERSEPVACEVISLIDRYRSEVFARFASRYGDLDIRVFGQNPKRGARGDDPRIVGTLPDAAYYAGIASCRVMIYEGLATKYHLHYHALEALMMGVPVLFFRHSAISQTALFEGVDPGVLRRAGMCESVSEMRERAAALLADAAAAVALSEAQELIRDLYRPARSDDVARALVERVSRREGYLREHADPAKDRPPPGGVRGFISEAASGIAGPILRVRGLRSRSRP